MQRRQVLLGATAILPGITGCICSSTSNGSLREVTIDLRNPDDRARTFHYALETEDGMMDWESHRVDPDADEDVTITLDEIVSPVALHGAIGGFAGSVNIIGVDNLEEHYCLHFHFWSSHPTDERPQLALVADIKC